MTTTGSRATRCGVRCEKEPASGAGQPGVQAGVEMTTARTHGSYDTTHCIATPIVNGTVHPGRLVPGANSAKYKGPAHRGWNLRANALSLESTLPRATASGWRTPTRAPWPWTSTHGTGLRSS